MTPAEHAAKAVELLAEAKRDFDNGILDSATLITAQAQVHATLAARPAGPDLVDAYLLHQAELDLETAKGRYRDYENGVAAIEDHLNQYGQDFSGSLSDIVDRVGELMALAYNDGPDRRTR